MCIGAATGGGSSSHPEEIRGWDPSEITEERVQELVIFKIQELVTHFFEKKQKIAAGKIAEAVNESSQGIWDSHLYVEALEYLVAKGKWIVLKRGNKAKRGEIRSKYIVDKKLPVLLGSSEYWEWIDDEGRKLPCCLGMKTEVLASEAFQSFSKGRSLLDSTTVIELAFALSVLEILGTEKFDALCDTISKSHQIYLGVLHQSTPLGPSPVMLFLDKQKSESEEGQVGMSYTYYTPITDRRFCVLCAGNDVFVGLGTNPTGATTDEVDDLCTGKFKEMETLFNTVFSRVGLRPPEGGYFEPVSYKLSADKLKSYLSSEDSDSSP